MREWHISDDWLQSDCLTVYARERNGDERHVIRFELTLEKQEPHTFIPSDYGLRLRQDDAQQLMNELWRVGMRPRDGAGSLAHVDAQKAHLEDMRRLVFDPAPRGPRGSNEA